MLTVACIKRTKNNANACTGASACRWTGSFVDRSVESDYIEQSLAKIKAEAEMHMTVSRLLLAALCASMHSLGKNEDWKISIWQVSRASTWKEEAVNSCTLVMIACGLCLLGYCACVPGIELRQFWRKTRVSCVC
jgi:hypothetical protein